jgi:site-specific recombinase XerD
MIVKLDDLVSDWRRHLRARNLAPLTISCYVFAAEKFCGGGAKFDGTVLPRQIETYLGDLLSRTSAANAAKHYRSLQQFFKWLVAEGEIPANPMNGMSPPKVPEKPVAIYTNADLIKLLNACKGNSFFQRRNAALIRVLMDTGIRAGELCGLRVSDVDLDIGLITCMGKGRRIRSVPISAKTSEALARYLRQRNKHLHAALSSLWLTSRGALTPSGLRAVLDRIGLRAQLKDVYPHRFRHTAAHAWLSAGGGERSLMRIMGWRSPAMLSRYGASAADERARDEHRRLHLADRL